MENTAIALPMLDLFGEQVIIQRRSFERRPRRKTNHTEVFQLGFLDILEMSDAELEALRARDEITDEYVEWLREYLLKITLRQIIHSQVSEQNWRDAMDWILSDEVYPFSFRVCCEAMMCDFEDVRAATLKIAAKELFK
ncbi:hypothetical protein FA341_15280 [Pseudomonas aeruginosa]|jgi:hypothetical protein|uniref:Uncharacterized protein n=1 Tax=Pseudomonas aeruginosa TaxID=287 RepID=A0A6C0L5A7_PSEAI|nr:MULTISPECIES: hypothetical protein [Pseudomonas aeruginosa group]EIU2642757.1 hypothetical protein [Pseudomonas aeruginosa]EIU9551178.1 hypothetical protein [Pseudomonas aeruginosa]EKC7897401.1 hypothetical protein [Pseudomonas aeruginosa]EKO0513531.1 hypothetical protein [Pseudomonas aeruginosa]EKQ9486150.1 hypothetical protein [Pseudomonas aeruginosa]